MAINFPNSPSDGQTTTILGVTYTYDSDLVTWTANPPGASSSGLDSAATISLINENAGSGVTSYDSAGLLPSSSNTAGDLAFVKNKKAMYVWDSSEWDRLYNGPETSLAWTTEALAGYSLNQDGTSTTITTAASDPEGFPVTYSYDVTPANQTQATIVDSGNGNYVLTPSTSDSDEGSFTFRSKATDGLYIISKSSTITLALSLADNDTVFFAPFQTNTTDTVNNITPTSGTGTISSTGLTAPDGTTLNALDNTAQNTQLIYGSLSNIINSTQTDWTIEFWGYANGTAGTFNTWISIGNGASAYTNGVLYRENDTYVNNSPLAALATGALGTTGQWVHHAIVGDNGSVRFYQDGTQVAEYTTQSTLLQNVDNFSLLNSTHNSTQHLDGYMRNLRISSISRYSGGTSFTPSTEYSFNRYS
jgi:hypothetical protein